MWGPRMRATRTAADTPRVLECFDCLPSEIMGRLQRSGHPLLFARGGQGNAWAACLGRCGVVRGGEGGGVVWDGHRVAYAGLEGGSAWGAGRCAGGGAVRGVWPGGDTCGADLPLASAGSDMIGWGRVLLSHTLDAARSY